MASPSQLLWGAKRRQSLATAQCQFANPGTGAAKRANNYCLRQGHQPTFSVASIISTTFVYPQQKMWREFLTYLSGDAWTVRGDAGIRYTTDVRFCCLLDRFGVASCLPGGCLLRSSVQHHFRVSFPPGFQAPLEAGVVESLRNHLEGDTQ